LILDSTVLIVYLVNKKFKIRNKISILGHCAVIVRNSAFNVFLCRPKISPRKDQKGNIVFVGSSKKADNVYQIKKLFKEFGTRTDCKRFEKVSQLRNACTTTADYTLT